MKSGVGEVQNKNPKKLPYLLLIKDVQIQIVIYFHSTKDSYLDRRLHVYDDRLGLLQFLRIPLD